MRSLETLFDAIKGIVEKYLEISTFSEERKQKIRTYIDSLEKKATGDKNE